MAEAIINLIVLGCFFDSFAVICNKKNVTKKFITNKTSTYITIKIPPFKIIISQKEVFFCLKKTEKNYSTVIVSMTTS